MIKVLTKKEGPAKALTQGLKLADVVCKLSQALSGTTGPYTGNPAGCKA